MDEIDWKQVDLPTRYLKSQNLEPILESTSRRIRMILSLRNLEDTIGTSYSVSHFRKQSNLIISSYFVSNNKYEGSP